MEMDQWTRHRPRWGSAIAAGWFSLGLWHAPSPAAPAPPPEAPLANVAQTPPQQRLQDLIQRGMQLMQEGRDRNALDLLLEAERLLPRDGDRPLAGTLLNNIGLLYHRQGAYPQAQGYLEQALTLSREGGDRVGEGSALQNLGENYRLTGQYDQALRHYGQALDIHRENRDRLRESITLQNRALVYGAQGRYREALEDHGAALAINRAIGYRSGEGQNLNGLAVIAYQQGRYRDALDYYGDALAISQATGNRIEEGAILNNRAAVHYQLGQYAEALAGFEGTLTIRREVGDRTGEASSLSNLGAAHRSLGRYGEALVYFQQALDLFRTLGNPAGEEATLRGMGATYNLSGQYDQAQGYYGQALTLSRAIGNRPGEGAALQGLAIAHHHLGDLDQALGYYQEALAVRRAIGDRLGEAATLRNLGRAHLASGALDLAVAALQEGLTVSAAIERDLGANDRDRVSFFDTWGGAWGDLQRVLVAQGQWERALEAADQARARSLADFLQPATAGQPRSPLTIAQMQQLARDRNATLLIYSVLDQELLAWVVAPSGQITFRSLDPAAIGIPIRTAVASTRATATNPINDFFFGSVDAPFSSDWVLAVRSGLTDAPAATDPGPLTTDGTDGLQQGYRLLIEPIEDLLPQGTGERLIIIPHRELGMLPFGALLDSQDRFLVERFTLSIAPSIQVLAALPRDRPRTGQGLLAIGNPAPMPRHNDQPLSPLAGAAQEAQTIAQFFDTAPLLGPQATETAVKARLDTADLLHFATHGIFQIGDRDVLDAWLALAPDPQNGEDGKLTLGEIFDRPLAAQIAVLSACDTGKGRITGEGVIGLARAFLRAGTPTVVASLWKVPDQQTAMLMEEFYQHLLAGRDRAEALRLAQLSIRARYPNPFYWAAFVIIGDGHSPY